MEMLDTDVLIDIQKNHPPARAWYYSLSDVPCITGFSRMELIQSCRNKVERDLSIRFLTSFQAIWPDQTSLSFAADIFTQYHLSHGLGLLDALIAATAMGAKATLLTFNTKHFQSIPGLKLAEPYVR